VQDVKLMAQYVSVLQTYANGNFKDFVRAMNKNPAMMEYLDTVRNDDDVPNGNYARELQAHEWGHLADAAGWVPRTVSRERYRELRAELAAELDAAIAAAPASARRATATDLAHLGRDGSAGATLARINLTRMPDYRANLVARAFMTEAEREIYVRHNVRTLRGEYPAPLLWRVLVRYLFGYQYLGRALGFTRVEEPRSFFLSSTWFADDFLATGVLDERRFDALAASGARLCACHAVDTSRLRLPTPARRDDAR
jgi:hypothetical protein